jgi:2-dehydropantoate 2-reductase
MSDVVVIGPGAIGCAFGAALVDAGHHVTFAARTSFDRLQVTYPAGEVDVDVSVVTDPDQLAPVPLVLLATKVHQTGDAAAFLRAVTGPDTVVAVLQNGVQHRETVEPLLAGAGTVLPTMVACPAHRERPGRAVVTGRTMLEVPNGPAADVLAGAFEGSFARIRPVDDWTTSTWTKLVINAASGIIGVLARRDNGVYADDEARDLLIALMREVAAVGRAEGADLPDELVPLIAEGLRRGAGNHMNSITADRLAGRPTEWRARNEVVVRLAERHGIDVPLNRLGTALIRLGEPPPPTERVDLEQ